MSSLDELQNGGVQKRKKGIATTRQILDAAAALFARNGYEGVTMRAIAAKVGINESSLYNHFSAKVDILNTLFDEFIRLVPQTRPSDEELDGMLAIMGPEEVLKSILFHVGKSVGEALANTAMIINYEKYHNPRATEMYYRYVIREPAEYYERLFTKMIRRGMIKPVDARMFAEQYNYVSTALTKEYIMAQYGMADVRSVVGYMVKTLRFYCELMKKDSDNANEGKQT
jgi:AcrR family transcriptional regulator